MISNCEKGRNYKKSNVFTKLQKRNKKDSRKRKPKKYIEKSKKKQKRIKRIFDRETRKERGIIEVT